MINPLGSIWYISGFQKLLKGVGLVENRNAIYIFGGLGGVGPIMFNCTYTHTSFYARDIFSCTHTHSSRYATDVFCCTCTHSSRYARNIFSCTYTQSGCHRAGMSFGFYRKHPHVLQKVSSFCSSKL